jgi:hypothetical protein
MLFWLAATARLLLEAPQKHWQRTCPYQGWVTMWLAFSLAILQAVPRLFNQVKVVTV